MSFDLAVFAQRVPQDLIPAWTQALAAHGLTVEFHPSFDGHVWGGGFLPIMVTSIAPGAFPAAHRYSAPPFVCGFELTVSDLEASSGHPGGVPGRYFELRTALGRSVADLRLQCFAAATLAIVTGGTVEDPQQDASFEGQEAIRNAAREADEYEAKWAKERDWDFIPVPEGGGWPA